MASIRFVIGCSLLFSVLLGGCTTFRPAQVDKLVSPGGKSTMFILFRHAERDDESTTGYLTAKGRDRALSLVETLSGEKITAIYAPDRGRNIETVQPLADHLGLTINRVPNNRLRHTRRFADEFVREALAAHAGGVVVWVGNNSPVGLFGGNLKEIYFRLGGTGKPPGRYNDICRIVVPDKGAVRVNCTQYGPPAH